MGSSGTGSTPVDDPADLAAQGVYVRVVQGLRTWTEQDALYAQGRTAPGKVVTNVRGGYSWHCFGCGWTGPWDRVARLLKLKGGAEWLVEDVASQAISDDAFAEMMG